MDLEILEALALSADRAAALAQLLPGSEDHDYYRCLHAQHGGALDEADTILESWPGRHGTTERLTRLRVRQLLYRIGIDPTEVSDEVRDHFGVQHWHEAEVDEVDPSRPTRLPPGVFDGARLLREAVGYSSDLGQVTEDGIDELFRTCDLNELDSSRRRSLLNRLGHTPNPRLVALVHADLEYHNQAFGQVRVHRELTRDQLEQLAAKQPKLRADSTWVDAMVRRMRPATHVDLDNDLPARAAYADELWAFVSTLPPSNNSLKGHVLWHVLDGYRRRDAAPPRNLVLAYLQLPRRASYIKRSLVDHVRETELVQVGYNYRDTTGLPNAGSDEELVRDLVHRDPAEAKHYEQWVETSWLDGEVATAHLLYASGNADKATHVLGPSRAAALRERIDLVWAPHNPTRFGADDPIVLDADVKHVPELVVKVFRIDPLAYFQHNKREVNTDLDLDGLAASHELVMTFTEPPVRRVRRRIELPMCTRPGTYVIDLIGNGMSSRAVVNKGRVRSVVRIGAAGHVVTILDETGQPRPDARAWIGDREYTPDANGAFVVPFSTSPGTHQLLVTCGDIAVVRPIELVLEQYTLTAEIHLDRQQLAESGTAKAIARVRLAVAGVPASLALVEKATWDVTLTDRHGVATTKQYPLTLSDDDASVLEWPLGEAPASVAITIRGKVRVVSQQTDVDLATGTHVAIAAMHQTTATEALYLARTAQGWVLSALGRNGEPRAQRPISVVMTHRWAQTQVVAELATDSRGRCELGELPGVSQISATYADVSQSWWVFDNVIGDGLVHAIAATEVIVPLPPDRDAADTIARSSFVELRGGMPVRHVDAKLEPLAGGISIKGLAPGDYVMRTPGMRALTIRVPVSGTIVGGVMMAPTEVLEVSRGVPVVRDLAIDGDVLHVRVARPTSRTRVHVIATRFVPTPIPRQRAAWSGAGSRVDRARAIHYVSGRELGDEYRYVLERRNAKRFPTLQLDKPSLLLNPWSRRTTTTDIATARTGGAFGASADAYASEAYRSAPAAQAASADADAYVGYDFLAKGPVVIANRVPDDNGSVRIPRADLGGATSVTVIIDDPAGSNVRRVALPEPVLDTKDLRLRLALDPARHATQKKTIAPLRSSETLVIEDLATAKIHLLDSVEKAHAYLLSLNDDSTLREFSFITKWHTLEETERHEKYSKYACHELHLFLYFKDRAFFDSVVKPYLAHKRVKTFLDYWLLDADVRPFVEPFQLAKLNAVERALLAQRLRDDPALVRIVGDSVDLLPPDPSRDAGLIEALLGASRLDADSTLSDLKEKAYKEAYEAEEQAMPIGGLGRGGGGFGPPGAPMAAAAPPPPPAAAPKARAPMKKAARRREASEKMDLAELADDEYGGMDMDMESRKQEAPMFRAADKTQEWAENNWWHATAAQQQIETYIPPNKLWRDLAKHTTGPFLSPWLGLATYNFAEALCALAVTDLPFIPGSHSITADGPRLTIIAANHVLAGSSQLVDGPLVEGGAPLVVGQSYVRTDDRHRWVDGEQVDKYVEGEFLAGIVYTCQVVLANPSSTRQRVAALIQIPKGSLPLAGARQTHTLDVVLEPYDTHGHEYAFYFPTPGQFTHFPVHVARGETIVAAAPARTLDVVATATTTDLKSWAHISQRGTLDEVLAFLETENLNAVEREKIAWRLKEKTAYMKIIAVLERRHIYEEVLWGYSLLHDDKPRIRVFLRALGNRLLQAGPVLDMPMVELDSEALASYEYLEYAPLTNARAHRLGAKLRILNEGLAGQYNRFLDLVAHRSTPTSEDLLAGAAYLLAQDRYEPALALLARVDDTQLKDRMQYDYLRAYAACLAGNTTAARELVSRWRQLPVDRWRRKFEALAAMLAELEGAAPTIVDPKSREQQQSELAAKQPAFDILVDRDGVIVRSQHIASLELRFFVMDVELLFSRQPFVQSDVSRFSFIEPGHREQLANLPAEQRIPWPAALRGKNVVVEAVGAGMRKAKIHYANDLATNLAHQYGQVRVQRASDQGALAATYVKVYARKRGGAVSFYKDGYTDLRGWFDYATLSTNELDSVERFAILVCSDQSGAAILEAGPPAR